MTIPKWAFDVAAERCNKGAAKPLTVDQWPGQTAFHELARCIAKHEQPPVDPLLIEARRIVAEDPGTPRTINQKQAIREGHAGDHQVRLVLTALCCGIEIGKSS